MTKSVTRKQSLQTAVSEEVADLVEKCTQIIENRIAELRQNARRGNHLVAQVHLEPMTGRYGEVKDRVFEGLKKAYEGAGWKITFKDVSDARWVCHWDVCLE